MKRNELAVYPFIFLLYIIIHPFTQNFMQIDAYQPLLFAGIIGICIFVCTLVGFRFVHNWRRSSYITFLLLVYVFAEGHFVRVLESFLWHLLSRYELLVFFVFWTLAFIFLSTNWVWKKIERFPQFDLFMTIVMVGTLVSPIKYIVEKVAYDMQHSQSDTVQPFSTKEALALSGDSNNDIYIIILDGYGRQDVLSRLYTFDNSDFLTSLEHRGFFIADMSRSNYVQTPLSIGSLLNLDYVSTWNPPMSLHEYRNFLQKIIADNELMNKLKDMGYRTISFDTGYFLTEMPDSNTYISKYIQLNPFETVLLSSTPIFIINQFQALSLPLQDYVTHRNRILYTFEKLGSLPVSDNPRLVYVYLLTPHPPFIFDMHGGYIDPPRSYETMDADQYRGTTEEYINGYRNQVEYINKLVLHAVDEIISNSKNPPIIVILGDHGPGSQFHWDSTKVSCMWERTSNLTAILLPNGSDGLFRAISPVNIFRVILNQYFGTELPLLEDRSYYSTDQEMGIITDVTVDADNIDGCYFSPNK